MDRTGKCMCGAVHFVIRDLDTTFAACHCKMCQRWAGSAFMGLTVPADTITIKGIENIDRFQSSEWAERAWCNKCGSNIWYQVTAEGPYAGAYHIAAGLLDDTSGLEITREYFVDEKIECLTLAGEREQFDTPMMMEMFGVDE